MKELTQRQQQILELIQQAVEKTGMPPTRAEIAAHFGFHSTYGAEKHLQALARKGVIELLPNASRGIRLIDTFNKLTGLPVVGRVAAGAPILAEECIETHYEVDASLFRPRADYLLRVQGMSMKDAGILDGDLLAVHRTPHAENGQIVVARIEGEVTVKRLKMHSRGGRQNIQLLPENPDFAPIDVSTDNEDFFIEGIAVGNLRIHEDRA